MVDDIKINIPNNILKHDKDEESNDGIFMRNTGTWNYRMLSLLKKIGEKSMGYRWMHDQEVLFYENLNSIYSKIELILLAILGTITSSLFIGLLSNIGLEKNHFVMIIITSLELLLLLCYSIVKGFHNPEYSKHIFNHNNVGAKFNTINLDIQEQLSLEIQDREVDKIFLKRIIKLYNELMEISPKIRKQTMNKYIVATKNFDIYKPLIADGFEIIDIENNNLNNKEQGGMNLDEKNNYQIERWLKHF